MSVTLNPEIVNGIVEILSIDGVGAAQQFAWRQFDMPSISLDASSTPPVSKVGGDAFALTAGAATIDLTAIPGVQGNVSFSGIKVVYAIFQNPGSNTITISEGASNGYAIGTHVIHPGGYRVCHFKDGLGDVSGTDKAIDLAGTGTDVLNAIFVAG